MKFFRQIFPCIFLIFAQCAEGNDQFSQNLIDSLSIENEILKTKIDSLTEVLNFEEEIQIVALNTNYCDEIIEGDSLKFELGIFYNRENFATTLYADVFTDSIAFEEALNNPTEYRFMYEIDLNETTPLSSTSLKFPKLNSSFCKVGGVFKISSNSYSSEYYRFQYDVNL